MSNSEKSMRVAIYIRVSTKLQEDRYSLSAQKNELTSYATSQGWEIVETFQDIESGGKLDKKGLEALLDIVEDGLIDVVLVIEQDRLSRLDAVDWEYLKDVLRRSNVKIAEPGSIVDLSNEDDEFISDIKNLIARRERRYIKRKMNRGIRQYTREGKLFGKQPIEYIYDKHTKSVTVNEDHAWVISYIDRLYLVDGYSMSGIAKELNKICTTHNGAKWTANQIKDRFNNKAYHGVLERTFMNGETIVVENVYPPLRTKETYEKIQMRMQNRTHLSPLFTSRSYTHPLRDVLMVCVACGNRLAIERGTPASDGRRNAYVTHISRARIVCEDLKPIHAERILRPLFQLIKSILLDESSLKQYFETYERESENLANLEREVDKWQARIESNESKLDRLLNLYLDGSWSSEKLNESKAKIENENKELAAAISNNLRKIELVKRDRYNLESYLEVIGDVEEYLSIFARMDENSELLPLELDEISQGKLISKMFDKIEIDDIYGKAIIHGKSVENVPITFTIDIDVVNVIAIDRLRKKQYERYLNTQKVIDSQPSPINFMELKRLTGLNVQTLNEDAALFGPYKNLKMKIGSPEKKEYALKIIKECLKEDIKMTSVDIAKRAEVNPSTVLRYIREFNLRPKRFKNRSKKYTKRT